MQNSNVYKTIVTWPSGGVGWFYTEASDDFEAETIVNFLLQRDYNWNGTVLETKPSSSPEVGTVNFLDGLRVKSRTTKTRYEDYET